MVRRTHQQRFLVAKIMQAPDGVNQIPFPTVPKFGMKKYEEVQCIARVKGYALISRGPMATTFGSKNP